MSAIYTQHGFGASGTATTTPAKVNIEEPTGTQAKARTVSVLNQGAVNLLVLFNVPATGLAAWFAARSPMIIPAGAAQTFDAPYPEGFTFYNVALAAESATADYVVNAY